MRGTAYFLIVLGVCYFVLLGLEYNRHSIQGQNWTATTATVKQAINSLPVTKFEPNRLNTICSLVNWSYVTYSYTIGPGHYDGSQELGPHLTIFDYMVGPMAVRLPENKLIDIRYNPRDPKESRVGLDVLHPVETLLGTGAVFTGIGLLLLYMSKISAATEREDDELDMPLEYFEKKRRAMR